VAFSSPGIQNIQLDIPHGVTLLKNILNEEGSGPHPNMCRMKGYLVSKRGQNSRVGIGFYDAMVILMFHDFDDAAFCEPRSSGINMNY